MSKDLTVKQFRSHHVVYYHASINKLALVLDTFFSSLIANRSSGGVFVFRFANVGLVPDLWATTNLLDRSWNNKCRNAPAPGSQQVNLCHNSAVPPDCRRLLLLLRSFEKTVNRADIGELHPPGFWGMLIHTMDYGQVVMEMADDGRHSLALVPGGSIPIWLYYILYCWFFAPMNNVAYRCLRMNRTFTLSISDRATPNLFLYLLNWSEPSRYLILFHTTETNQTVVRYNQVLGYNFTITVRIYNVHVSYYKSILSKSRFVSHYTLHRFSLIYTLFIIHICLKCPQKRIKNILLTCTNINEESGDKKSILKKFCQKILSHFYCQKLQNILFNFHFELWF
ncbi:hypothetical protein QTP88_005465 [Uroleucon formosanum]